MKQNWLQRRSLACKHKMSCLNIRRDPREIVNMPNKNKKQPRRKSVCLMGETWYPFSQQALVKAWFLPCFTVCSHQTRIAVYEKQYRSYFAVKEHHRRPYFRYIIAVHYSIGIVVSFFMSFSCLRTSIAACFTDFLQARNTRSDDVSDLSISRPILDFWLRVPF